MVFQELCGSCTPSNKIKIVEVRLFEIRQANRPTAVPLLVPEKGTPGAETIATALGLAEASKGLTWSMCIHQENAHLSQIKWRCLDLKLY